MPKHPFFSVAGLLSALLLFSQAPAQVASQPSPSSESVFTHVNRQAILSRAGDTPATSELAHQLFKNVGIPTEIADSFGFTDRVVQAETAHRNGTLPAVQEADVVKAVNNLTRTIGAPQPV
jgi:hypothetical protein